MYVYTITNKVDDSVYVGKAIDPNRRWQRHLAAARRGQGYLLHEKIRKFGSEQFEFCVIECWSSEEEAFLSEKFWIAQLKAAGINVYNMNGGGIVRRRSPNTLKTQIISPPSAGHFEAKQLSRIRELVR